MRRPIRRIAWLAGAPARLVLIALVSLYRVSLAGILGGQCRFQPSCSEYAIGAIRTRGAVVGTALAAWRVLRCNPFGRSGPDPVPAYDSITQRGLP